MYTIISGTNRKESHTEKVANEYKAILENKNIDACLFSLKDLNVLTRNDAIKKAETEILIPTQKFIFIIPEYNGSYPGVLKALIDNSDIKNVWNYKKALLTGVATGRAGNLRGMDHLSDTLHYMKMNVFYNKLPISVVDKVMDKDGHFNVETTKAINQQLDEFINF
jgi:NAD(P)H-dependent FMN reductase